MKAKYINPFTDYGFKKLFGEEASKKLLISFLNDLLPISDKIPDILKEDIFEEAFKVAEIANFTPEEISEYEESLKIYRDNINVIETAKEEGREEGVDYTIQIIKYLKENKNIDEIVKLTNVKFEKVKELENLFKH